MNKIPIGFVLSLSTVTYFAIERPGRDWLAGQRKGRSTKDFAQLNQRDVL